MNKKNVKNVISLIIVIIFIGTISFFLFRPKLKPYEIPSHVTGDTREIYEWAKTERGIEVLEQIPCYCGCKYEGHLHTRHCFWEDDGTFDDHGQTCGVCQHIGKTSMEMDNEGKDICEIRNFIDDFYVENILMSTDTPMPEGCK